MREGPPTRDERRVKSDLMGEATLGPPDTRSGTDLRRRRRGMGFWGEGTKPGANCGKPAGGRQPSRRKRGIQSVGEGSQGAQQKGHKAGGKLGEACREQGGVISGGGVRHGAQGCRASSQSGGHHIFSDSTALRQHSKQLLSGRVAGTHRASTNRAK